MHLFVQQIINGILLGGMFALMSIGLSMIFGIMKTANFAYGSLYMLGGYVAYWSSVLLQAPFLVAVVIAFVVMFGAGVIVEYFGFAPLRGNEDAALIFGLGLSLVIRGGATIAWGSQNRFIMSPFEGAVFFGHFVVPAARFWAGLVSLAIVGAVYFMIERTRLGRVLRAVSDDSRRASLLGINTKAQFCFVFGLGTALSALACVFLIPVFSLLPDVDDTALYIGFAVVILGGLGSIPGCIVGAMILGLVNVMAFAYTDSSIAPIFPLAILILTLMLRPQGLLGKKGRLA